MSRHTATRIIRNGTTPPALLAARFSVCRMLVCRILACRILVCQVAVCRVLACLVACVAPCLSVLPLSAQPPQPARRRPPVVMQHAQRAPQRPPQPAPAARQAAQPPAQSSAQPTRTPAPIVRAAPASAPQNANQSPTQNAAQSSVQRPAPSTNSSAVGVPLVVPNRPGQTQQHLAGWMDKHSNLSPAEQQKALDSEPGVRELPAQEQQALHNRLHQLNNMSPTDRTKTIAHIEDWERLRPKDRQAVTSAMTQLGSLPEDRQHAVSRAFHTALTMPEQQRQNWLNAPQNRTQFNENERDTLNHLLQVQPAAAQAGFTWAKPPAAHE